MYLCVCILFTYMHRERFTYRITCPTNTNVNHIYIYKHIQIYNDVTLYIQYQGEYIIYIMYQGLSYIQYQGHCIHNVSGIYMLQYIFSIRDYRILHVNLSVFSHWCYLRHPAAAAVLNVQATSNPEAI